MTPTTNHELLQTYIDEYSNKVNEYTSSDIAYILRSIQNHLISPVEYEIGKEYEFYNYIDGWIKGELSGFYRSGMMNSCYSLIRPIQVPDEVSSAITLLEQEGYIVTKK